MWEPFERAANTRMMQGLAGGTSSMEVDMFIKPARCPVSAPSNSKRPKALRMACQEGLPFRKRGEGVVLLTHFSLSTGHVDSKNECNVSGKFRFGTVVMLI